MELSGFARTLRVASFHVNRLPCHFLPSVNNQATEKCTFKQHLVCQPAFAGLKLTIKTLEQGLKFVKFNNKDTRMTQLASF